MKKIEIYLIVAVLFLTCGVAQAKLFDKKEDAKKVQDGGTGFVPAFKARNEDRVKQLQAANAELTKEYQKAADYMKQLDYQYNLNLGAISELSNQDVAEYAAYQKKKLEDSKGKTV